MVRFSIFTVWNVVLFSIAWTSDPKYWVPAWTNLAVYRKDHDILNLTKARCSRHTFYTLAVIHEHIFDMEIV